MDAYDCVATKLDIRDFSTKNVPPDVKLKILEAARLTGSGVNYQHWHFIVVQGKNQIHRLAENSTTGEWIVNANFAVIVLTNHKYGFHLLDAGRVIQDMQIAAWNFGVGSGIFTGVDLEKMRKDYGIPNNLTPSGVVGFGYPARKITGKKKNRKPLAEIVSIGEFGNRFDPGKLT